MDVAAVQYPVIVESVFTRIFAEMNTSGNKKLSERDYVELNALFGDTLREALDILDRNNIILYQQSYKNSLMQESFEISPPKYSNSSNTTYSFYPDVNYCSCPQFQFEVIENSKKYTCKHVLAVKLAKILGAYKVKCLNNKSK